MRSVEERKQRVEKTWVKTLLMSIETKVTSSVIRHLQEYLDKFTEGNNGRRGNAVSDARST